MNGQVEQIGLWQMVSAYIFVLFLLFIVRRRKIGREKEITIAALRMTLQLVLVGYVLVFVFDLRHPGLTVLYIAAMLVFAVFNIFRRVKTRLNRQLKLIIAGSIGFGALVSLIYFILVVIMLDPWYEPRYVIPIAGMIVGNSMTGISLGVKHLADGMKQQREHIEGALMMGAQPKEAVRDIVNSAFDSATLPTINSMVGMGIVFLPGMMTGQILSGVSPLTAINYQIAIMLGILGSVSLCVIVFVIFGYRAFFNKRAQLVSME